MNTEDFFNSGSTNQVTLRENSTAFSKYRLRPRVLRDVSTVRTDAVVFGTPIKFPLCISPAGLHAMAHPDGELATSRACAQVGVNMGVSSFANYPVEEIVAAGRAVGPIAHAMQMYTLKDRAIEESLIRRAEAAGCRAILLTADSPVLGWRYNEKRTDFRIPSHLKLPMLDDLYTKVHGANHSDSFASLNSDAHTWAQEIPWLRSVTGMEIWIKGVLTAEDVELAIEHGCDGVLISNHGGRQLDDVPATIDVLPDCARAARGRIRLHVDGGIRSGSDIFKALALGAECCWVGRPALWGLAVSDVRPGALAIAFQCLF